MLDADATSATIFQSTFMEPTKLGPLVGSSKRNGATIELCRTFLFPDTRGAFGAFSWPKAPRPPRLAPAPPANHLLRAPGPRRLRSRRSRAGPAVRRAPKTPKEAG